jgi:hypothetical protein
MVKAEGVERARCVPGTHLTGRAPTRYVSLRTRARPVVEAGCLAKEDRSMALKERGAITGIGETAYSRNSGKSVVALQMEASLGAIADAGLSPKDIDGIIAYAPSGVVAEDFVTNFGIPLPFR